MIVFVLVEELNGRSEKEAKKAKGKTESNSLPASVWVAQSCSVGLIHEHAHDHVT